MLTHKGFSLQAGSVAALLLSSMIFRVPPLILLSYFLVLFSSTYIILAHRYYLRVPVAYGLKVRRSVDRLIVAPGKEANVVLDVKYDGGSRLACVIEDKIDHEVEVSGEVSWRGILKPSSSLRLIYKLKPTKRGAYKLGPLLVRLSDPYSICVKHVNVGEPSYLISVPVPRRIKSLVRGPRAKSWYFHAGSALNPFTGPEEEFEEIRPYQEREPLRRIDWKAVARSSTDDIYVREYNRQGQLDMLVVLWGSEVEEVHEDILESAVSLVSFLYGSGDKVGMVAMTEEGPESLEPSSGKHNFILLMKLIAKSSYPSDTLSMVDEIKNAVKRLRSSALTFLIGLPSKRDLTIIDGAFKEMSSKAFMVIPTYSSIATKLRLNVEGMNIDEEEDKELYRRLESIKVIRAPIDLIGIYVLNLVRLASPKGVYRVWA